MNKEETKTEYEIHSNPMLAMKVNTDTKLKEYFDLEIIKYTGDNSIFILGTKKN